MSQLDAECARTLVEGDLKFVDLRGLEEPAADVRAELERAGSRFLFTEPRR